MKQINTFNYYEDENVQIIEMLYKDDDLSAIIILPQLNHTVDEFINEMLFPNIMDNYLNKMEYNEVEIHLPKFTVESHLNLNNVLKQVGIKRPFNNTAADFKLISPHGNLYISSIIQRTVIKVNEKGTEAASVTAVVLDGALMPQVHIKKVVVNRPFIFMIKDNVFTKNYAFIAKVVNL
jgi:serpin B